MYIRRRSTTTTEFMHGTLGLVLVSLALPAAFATTCRDMKGFFKTQNCCVPGQDTSLNPVSLNEYSASTCGDVKDRFDFR